MVFFGEVVAMMMILGLTLARHWHGLVMQMQGYSHVGIVFSRGALR